MWRDDARLDDFHERVVARPLPPETRSRDDSVATFGKNSSGNGDYCEYRVRLKLRTGLSPVELYAYYDKAAIAGVDVGMAQVSVDVDDAGDGGAVIVEFRDISSSDWDIRCA
ncbi:hypothetical protein GCM10012289_28520 [Nonomuraea cavernae]|uniref:Uncharacterized protein n=2 Tax=Nonomuraea cavernae TaxID=2045107 RepID=A0A917YWD9_9ACTN|nr:hypothetical protein GCM10012289_28520 [Nonomuraea cavernae]